MSLSPLKGRARCFFSARGSRAGERLKKKAGGVAPKTPLLRARFQPPHSHSKRYRQVLTAIRYAKRVSRKSPGGHFVPPDARAAQAGPHWGRPPHTGKRCERISAEGLPYGNGYA